MKCPCGCSREVSSGHYWATPKCGEDAKKKGLYMPQGGACRQDERARKRFHSFRKGRK